MKTFIAALCTVLCVTGRAQTAANWTVNDCSGQSRELFADLDAGKVAVIIWVMPCAYCIDEAIATKNEVEDALSANPGKIVFYMVDDFGNTNCSTLSGWAAANGINNAILITSKTVSMDPYGASGMPKVVVAGGTDHKVYYNENAPDVTATGIRSAISAALSAPVGIAEFEFPAPGLSVAPNPPGEGRTELTLTLPASGAIDLEVRNEAGRLITRISRNNLGRGTHPFSLQTGEWANGTYFLTLRQAEKEYSTKLIIVR